jgi:hypothetical protein
MADKNGKTSKPGLDMSGIDLDDKDGILVQGRSGLYKPETAKTLDAAGKEAFIPLRGILMGASLKKADSDKPFYVLEMRLTRPTYVENRDKQPVRLEIGDTAIIPVTTRLRPWLQVAQRENPSELVELKIVPDSKEDIGGGKSLWEYKVSVIGKHRASDLFSLESLLADAPMLTAGDEVDAGAVS